jgi:hypothetical protein
VRSPADSVAAFDSALGTVRVLAAALRGAELARLGQGVLAAAGVRATTALPAPLRRTAYARAGAAEAVPPDQLSQVDLGAVAGYIADRYPTRSYPAALVGAANGAMTHLAAAAQVPWLPQTVLVPVRWAGNEPDRPDRALAWGARIAEPLLERNADIELHHMHDGNQDKLMVSAMAYFRCKWTGLPEAYRRFLQHNLQPGAPIILVRGRLRWPVTRVAALHVFQHGAYGGLEPDDYARRPHAPATDDDAAEAEWGTTSAFEAEARRWGNRHGHPVLEVVSSEPQELADRAATVLLDWRRSNGVAHPPVVVDQFIQTQPWHVLRSGAVPYWTVFPVERCADAAEAWIRRNGPFRRVDVALFNHGVVSEGLADAGRWRRITRAGQHPGELLGQREHRFPADFAALTRATAALRRLPDGPPWPLLPVTRLALR